MKYLLIGGCPRSGTTALRETLNADTRVAIGLERFKYVASTVGPEHFELDRFLAPDPSETNFIGHEYIDDLERRLIGGAVQIIGDKVPLYAVHLRRIASRFASEDVRFAILLRDPLMVANSFEARATALNDSWPRENDHAAAARFWNRCGEGVMEYVSTHGDERICVIPYERFFSGDQAWVKAVGAFAGILPSPDYEQAVRASADRWSARGPDLLDGEALSLVRSQVDWDLARALYGLSERHRRRYSDIR